MVKTLVPAAKHILDTSILIGHWQRSRARVRGNVTSETTRQWARDLIEVHETDAIVTPVFVEFLAGVQSSSELGLARAFLSVFRIADGGRILSEDWEHAKRLAARVPPDGKPRQLGDCLIRGIAIRLRYDVRTHEKRFPKR